MGDTKISWATKTWNCVEGCSPVSEGCRYCYGKRLAPRLGVDFSKVTLHPKRLEEPLRWRKPQRVFVCSRSDLFHEDVPLNFIGQVLTIARALTTHTFLFLTKRPARMREALLVWDMAGDANDLPCGHLWFGVSAENQEQADKRIPLLLQTPAAVRWVSLEPLLEGVDLSGIHDVEVGRVDALTGKIYDSTNAWRGCEYPPLDLVIVGGESGPHHRPMEVAWLRSIVEQCKAAQVPVYVKQASHARPGQQGDIPDELWQIKEMPR